eukprot:9001355-Alexandrium_andersonii.AAC.1
MRNAETGKKTQQYQIAGGPMLCEIPHTQLRQQSSGVDSGIRNSMHCTISSSWLGPGCRILRGCKKRVHSEPAMTVV